MNKKIVKDPGNKKVVYTFTTQINFHLNELQREGVKKAINKHYLGTENCNHYNEDGVLVENEGADRQDLKDAHWKLKSIQSFTFIVDVYEDGSFGNFRVK